ncbi:MAG: single-stranded-DNA-specific exonuclease RecJ [Bacteroidetes bacterium GWF2_49_14]|nr:MAG: single-stranded-DNA-specific exonuclease RecJ [Bacteroidetes bacterium GWF2_49_14]HBB92948.1 single-stranded-DNA-specific exonuclease RecJ [Bacteroidales bacterium]
MNKLWKIASPPEPVFVESLANELGIGRVLASLLVQRGIRDFEEARHFFRPQVEGLHNPFLMKDMDKAVERIGVAIANQEKVLVYGDYDVDGTTSVALIYSFLRKRIKEIGYYIPDRYSEGYGISFQGIEYAMQNGYSLVIALDCGIKSTDKMDYARRKGIEFIICDHHLPDEELPVAVAILDPKRPDCEYPYKELSGCGVGFKLLQGYCLRNGIPFSHIAKYLDMVCVSIAADLVPMTGENRILAYHGLKKLNENPIPGLKALINISNCDDRQVTASDIVFKIGPRINAAGRISSGESAVELLVAKSEAEAVELAGKIDSYNDYRKNIDVEITETARKMVENNDAMRSLKTTVLFHPEWHKGVVGIVASRLIDYYYRPTVVLTKSNGMATGSARSVDTYDLYYAINACSDLLESFGGHKYAAGLSMPIENVEVFTRRFEEIVASTITDEQLVPQILIDCEIELSEITPKFFRVLRQFEPFGPDNQSPVFVCRNLRDNGKSRQVGRTWEHLKLNITSVRGDHPDFEGIAFGMGHLFGEIHEGKHFDITFTVEENTFRGATSMQLMVKDIRIQA